MHPERKRALAIFLCSCVPLSIEVIHSVGMLTIVDWKIVCLTFLYWRLAESATRCSSSPVMFAVVREATRVALCAVVAYAWLSFLTSMRAVAVGCLLGDVTGRTYRHAMFSSCRGGIGDTCLNAIEELNRSSWTTRQCPSNLIGSRLAYAYFFLVTAFRFVACALYGLWNIFTWTESRFQDGSFSTSRQLPKQHEINHDRLLGSISVILSCVMVEIAMQGKILSLSSPHVILPYLAVVSLQYTLKSKRMRESSKEALIFLQKQAISLSFLVSLLDLLIQTLFVTSVCIPDIVSVSELTQACTRGVGTTHMTRCHELISKRTVRPIPSDMCPSLLEKNNSVVVILYTANIIKVFVLSLGTLILSNKRNEK